MEPRSKSSKWVGLLKLVVGFGLMGLLVWQVSWEKTIGAFVGMDWLWFFAALAVGAIGIFLSSLKLWVLLGAKKIRIPFHKVWGLYYIGAFFNNFLPTSVGGDVVKIWGLARYSGDTMESVSATLMERITGFFVIVMVGLGILLAGLPMAEQLQISFLQVPAWICLALMILSPVLYLLFRTPLDRAFGRFQGKLFIKARAFGNSLTGYFKAPKVLGLAVLISIFFHAERFLMLIILGRCVGVGVEIAPLVLVVSLVTLAAMLPLSINSLGIREGALVFFLIKIGPSPAQALAIAILFRIVGFFNSAIGGLLFQFQDIKPLEAEEKT